MLEWTGERFLPWIKDATIAYEHLHRYAYAATLVKHKRVLDLACGEGYGSKLLSTSASFVLGIDIDENTVRHAREKYGGANLKFDSGSVTAVPVKEDHSFEAIICFEAIEHIDDQETLLTEVKRLLKPDGVFIVSTPNKAIYGAESREENPFHVRELHFDEFQRLLAPHFRNIRFLGQRIHPSSSIWCIDAEKSNGFHEFVIDRTTAEFEFIESRSRIPLYFIALASDAADSLPPSGSVLVDDSDSLLEEKNRETAWNAQQVKDRDAKIVSLEEALQWRQGQIEQLTEGLEWTRNCSREQAKTIESQDEALAWRAHQVGDLEQRNKSLTETLQATQQNLIAATETLDGIYASRGWKWLEKLRRIRDRLQRNTRSRPGK